MDGWMVPMVVLHVCCSYIIFILLYLIFAAAILNCFYDFGLNSNLGCQLLC